MRSINDQIPQKILEKYEKGFFNFPPENVPHSDKSKKEWCAAFAMAIWGDYCKGNTGLPYTANGVNQYDYATIRQYADGNQPVDKYKEQVGHPQNEHSPDEQDKSRFSYNKAISWANQSIIPKYRKATIANLMDMDIDLTPIGVDENSMKERQRVINYIWERSQNAFYDRIYGAVGQKDEPLPFIPADKQELELFRQNGLELIHEQEMKKVVDRTFEINNWNVNIKRKLLEDLFDLGICLSDVDIDSLTGLPTITYFDPEYSIFNGSLTNNYSDMEEFGQVLFIPVKKLRAILIRDGVYVDEQTLLQQISPYTTTWGINIQYNNQGNKDSHGQYPYDYKKVPVLKCQYKSYNVDVHVKKKTKNGFVIEEFRSSNSEVEQSENVKVTKYPWEMWYTCTWVIGTDIFYNYGPKRGVKRDKNGKTYSGVSIIRLSNQSFGNQLIPIEDDNELVLKKFQIAWLNARPSGFILFWEALTNLTDGTLKVSVMEAFQLFMDKGILLANSDFVEQLGIKQVQHILEPLVGGVGPILNEYVQSYNMNITKINDIVGISGVLAGDQPIPGQLVQTTEIAQNQSLKAISHIAEAYNYIKKSTYQKVIYDIQMLSSLNPDGLETLFTEFSTNTIQKVKIGADRAGIHYEMRVDTDATMAEKQAIVEAAFASAGNGSLSWPDALLIQELVRKGRSRWARIIMEYRMGVNQQREQQNQLELIQQNSETQQQSIINNLKAKIQEIAAKGQQDRDTEILKGEIEKMLMILEASLDAKQPKQSSSTPAKKPQPKKQAA